MRLLIITSDEVRHRFFVNYLSNRPIFSATMVIIESTEGRLITSILDDPQRSHIEKIHLSERQQFEQDFFGIFNSTVPPKGESIALTRGEFNHNSQVHNRIHEFSPDVIVSYGCSLIKEPLITDFAGRFLNIHLGLSPYYRGNGTNFWPFVNREPQYVGVTYMLIDAGVDTGDIVHQIRPTVISSDNIHTIGNRLIKDMTIECETVVRKLSTLVSSPQIFSATDRIYKQSDYCAHAVQKMRHNFSTGMLEEYISNKDSIDSAVPIIQAES